MNLSGITVLLADDDPDQLSYLVALIKRLRPDWQIVAKFTSAGELKVGLEELSPSLAILDVRYAGTTALEIVRSLRESSECPIIFVTGDPSYAADAFTCDALDFVLKPLKADRFEQALKKAETFFAKKTERAVIQPFNKSLRMIRGHDLVLVKLSDVCYFQANRKYTRVVLHEQEGLIKMGIALAMEFLDTKVFWRIHRGLILNLDHMAYAKRDELGRMVVALTDRKEHLVVSKPYENKFRDGFS